MEASDEVLCMILDFLPGYMQPVVRSVSSRWHSCTDWPSRVRGTREAFVRDSSIELLEWFIDNGYVLLEDDLIIATKYGRLEVLKWAQAYGGESVYYISPESRKVISFCVGNADCRYTDLARKTAAEYGHIHILEYFNPPLNEKICESAAIGGRINVIEWALAKGYSWSNMVCTAAAMNNHPHVIEWAIANDRFETLSNVENLENISDELLMHIKSRNVPVNFRTLSNLALQGRLEMIKYLVRRGVSINGLIYYPAAKGGHLEVMKWAYERGITLSSRVAKVANGHIHILEWLLEKGITIDYYSAARDGHLEAIKWAHAKGIPMTDNICGIAAKRNHFEVLKWARAAGVPWNDNICEDIITSGNLEMLQWALKAGAPWDESALEVAIKKSHINIIEWALSKGYNISGSCKYAARSGKFDKIKKLKKLGFALDSETCEHLMHHGHLNLLIWARANGATLDNIKHTSAHLGILKWARANGMSMSEFVYAPAAELGYLHILKWAHANGAQLDGQVCVGASKCRQLKTIKWLHSIGCPWDGQVCVNSVGDVELFKWVRANGCPWGGNIASVARDIKWIKKHDIDGGAEFEAKLTAAGIQ